MVGRRAIPGEAALQVGRVEHGQTHQALPVEDGEPLVAEFDEPGGPQLLQAASRPTP